MAQNKQQNHKAPIFGPITPDQWDAILAPINGRGNVEIVSIKLRNGLFAPGIQTIVEVPIGTPLIWTPRGYEAYKKIKKAQEKANKK